MIEFEITEVEVGERLDVALARHGGVSRSVAVRAITEGNVFVDGATPAKSLRLEEGMRVQASLPSTEPPPLAPENIDVRIVFEDEHLLVLSKPAGLVVHPAPGHPTGTLVNALLSQTTPAGGSAERPGIVHRLDAGTSGLMIVAKTDEVHAALVEQMSERLVRRTYLTMVEGDPETATATIDAPIGRSPKQRKMMAVVAGGKDSVTWYQVLERFGVCAYLEVQPHTGRTHQIRVHLSATGHPVIGDPVYGGNRELATRFGLDRPFLHAARLRFEHPVTAAAIDLSDPLPDDLARALEGARALSA